MRDGGLVVLKEWVLDALAREVVGVGTHYNASRDLQKTGQLHVAYADIALFETNRVEEVVQAPFVVLGVVAGISLAVTAMCLSNPKACFGSCPNLLR